MTMRLFDPCWIPQSDADATSFLREQGAAVAFIFEKTDIRRVIGVTDSRNIASLRLLENLGMQRLQTDTALFRGSPCEEHLYALHRSQP